MFHQLETYLNAFRPCFKRLAAFKWFVILVVGFLLRSDIHRQTEEDNQKQK